MAKAGKVRTRKRGKTWSYIFEAGIVNVKRKVVEKGGFVSEKEAYTAGVEKYTDYLHGNIGITSEAIALGDFITNWLNEVVALDVKANTLQTYQSIFNNRIMPSLGGLKVQELTPAILDKWVRSLQKAGLSFKSISLIRTLVHHALDYAVHPSRLITSNPVDYVRMPKNLPKNIIKRQIISLKKFKSLLEKYPFGTAFHIPLLLLYYTGMRLSEVLGLSWSDIDFPAKQIKLRRQLIYLKRRGYYFTTLKNDSSNRFVLISDCLSGVLQRWQVQQADNQKKFTGSYIYTYVEGDGHIILKSKVVSCRAERVSLICVQSNGQLVYRGVFMKALAKEGLNAHSFRHAHATRLIESGAQAKGVSARLGYTNAMITQNLYAHNTLKLKEETLAIFDKNMQINA